MKILPAAEAKTNFGALIDDAQREPITIARKGRPVSVMMSIQEYEKYQALKLERLRALVAEGEAAIKRGDYTTITNAKELHGLFEKINTENKKK